MAFIRSDQQRAGRYVQGGASTIRGNNIGWWERALYPKSPTDVPFIITRRYVGRPDLLAYDVYGTATLQWFVMQYNTIIDVHTELTEGARILLPTKARLFGELLSKSR